MINITPPSPTSNDDRYREALELHRRQLDRLHDLSPGPERDLALHRERMVRQLVLALAAIEAERLDGGSR